LASVARGPSPGRCQIFLKSYVGGTISPKTREPFATFFDTIGWRARRVASRSRPFRGKPPKNSVEL